MPWLHAVIDVPAGEHAVASAFWQQVLGWPLGAPWPQHPELASFEPSDGTPYVHLQQVDGPPRVHVDVESPDWDGTTERAVATGARVVDEHDRWRTFLSPGGLPFCLVHPAEHAAAGPVTGVDGHRTRLVQVCVDSPPDRHDREVDFWRSLLPGRWVDSASPEFAGKWHDDAGSPLQLLFQRTDDGDGPVRAHLDLGTDDLSAEVDRLVALGAADEGRGRGWHVVRAPDGSPFCATLNSPATGRVRDLG